MAGRSETIPCGFGPAAAGAALARGAFATDGSGALRTMTCSRSICEAPQCVHQVDRI